MASTAASQRSPQKKPRSSLGLLGFWALLLACSSAMFFACAYALDAVPDNVLALLLRAGILFFGSVMIPLALATGLWFAGIKGRRAIIVALFVSASSALAGYVHWRDVPMPWDDIVRAPQYIETRAWETLYDWQADPEQVPWNVLEPAFPRIERVFTRPQTSATRAQVRQSDFRWHSIYFLRASGFRIFGRFELDDAGNARNVYGFLRLPASPYLELQRGTKQTAKQVPKQTSKQAPKRVARQSRCNLIFSLKQSSKTTNLKHAWAAVRTLLLRKLPLEPTVRPYNFRLSVPSTKMMS